MRIAICLSQFYPTTGGAENQLLLLARQWKQWGHACTVFTRPVPNAPAMQQLSGITVRRCLHTVNLGPLFGLSFVGNLCRSLHRHRREFDVLLAAQAPWEAVATGLMGPLLKKPAYVRIANTGPFGDLGQLHAAKASRLLRRCFLKNSGFFALSGLARTELLETGCAEATIHPITNAVDTERFCPLADSEERDRTVLFVGRLAPQKDPLTLLSAWKQVNCEDRYHLLIAGSGPLEQTMRQQCERDRLTGVEFLGSRSDIPAVHCRAATFVLPSLGEGCSNALLEAMASGLCPVVTAIGGNTDVINDRQNGLLFEPGDPHGLARALNTALEDHELRHQWGANARQSAVTRHGVERVARAYLDVFDNSLSRMG